MCFFGWGLYFCYFMDTSQAYKNYEIHKIIWDNHKKQSKFSVQLRACSESILFIFRFLVSENHLISLVIILQVLASALPTLLLCNIHKSLFPFSSTIRDLSQFITTEVCLELTSSSPVRVTSVMMSVLGFWFYLFDFRNDFFPFIQC